MILRSREFQHLGIIFVPASDSQSRMIAPQCSRAFSSIATPKHRMMVSPNIRWITAEGLAVQTISVTNAVAKIPDGACLLIGGFMAVGTPERVIDEIVRQGKRGLTVICQRHGAARRRLTHRCQARRPGGRQPYRPQP